MNIGPDRLEQMRGPQILEPLPQQRQVNNVPGNNFPPNPYFNQIR